MRSIADGEFETVGEAVFNLGLNRDFGAGAYSCARCHTAGWSLGLDVVPDVLDEGVAGCGGGSPSGIGFNLCGSSVQNHFPDDAWLRPDNSWYGPNNPSGYDGSFIEAMDGTQIALNESGNPETASGEPYLILAAGDGVAVPAEDDAEGEATDEAEDLAAARNGDLAECSFVSGLWQPEAGLAYAFDPVNTPVANEEGDFEDPEVLTLEAAGDGAFILGDNRIVSGCTCLLYTSPSPRDATLSRMPSSA